MSGKLAMEIAHKAVDVIALESWKWQDGSVPPDKLQAIIAEAIEEGMKACRAECQEQS